ncbi:MAG: cell division protein ZapA [Thermodesulfobacteriota bacterium]|nr:cell division protein ZapA [Thermodesulfobacteriota bacterium]
MGDAFITIQLFGKSYKFRVDEDVPNAEKVARLVEKEVHLLEEGAAVKTPHLNNFAVLTQAALNIANEFVELKEDYSGLIHDISGRSSALIAQMDAYLQ